MPIKLVFASFNVFKTFFSLNVTQWTFYKAWQDIWGIHLKKFAFVNVNLYLQLQSMFVIFGQK
jgi:hypothetical protein